MTHSIPESVPRFTVAILAQDRTGIVAEVLLAVENRGWVLGHGWAATRGGLFFMAVEIKSGTTPVVDASVDAFCDVFRAEGLLVLKGEQTLHPFYPSTEESEVSAEIQVRGTDPDRLVFCRKTAEVARDHEATIVEWSSELSDDAEIKYVLRTKYSHKTDRAVRKELEELADTLKFAFTVTSQDE